MANPSNIRVGTLSVTLAVERNRKHNQSSKWKKVISIVKPESTQRSQDGIILMIHLNNGQILAGIFISSNLMGRKSKIGKYSEPHPPPYSRCVPFFKEKELRN